MSLDSYRRSFSAIPRQLNDGSVEECRRYHMLTELPNQKSSISREKLLDLINCNQELLFSEHIIRNDGIKALCLSVTHLEKTKRSTTADLPLKFWPATNEHKMESYGP